MHNRQLALDFLAEGYVIIEKDAVTYLRLPRAVSLNEMYQTVSEPRWKQLADYCTPMVCG